jgi:hypothetical protein
MKTEIIVKINGEEHLNYISLNGDDRKKEDPAFSVKLIHQSHLIEIEKAISNLSNDFELAKSIEEWNKKIN